MGGREDFTDLRSAPPYTIRRPAAERIADRYEGQPLVGQAGRCARSGSDISAWPGPTVKFLDTVTGSGNVSLPFPPPARARGAYAIAIRRQLAVAGFDDMPSNGPFVLGGLVNREGSAADLIRELGISKQAASELIDTLVGRGYLARQTDAQDRRRITLLATDRGRAAAAAVLGGVRKIDSELAEMLTAAQLAGLHDGLIALTTIRERLEHGAEADSW